MWLCSSCHARVSRGTLTEPDAANAINLLPLHGVAVPSFVQCDDNLELRDEIEAAIAAVGAASDRYPTILARRILRGETLEMIGNALGVSKERVRQIEEEAMEYLRLCMGQTDMDCDLFDSDEAAAFRAFLVERGRKKAKLVAPKVRRGRPRMFPVALPKMPPLTPEQREARDRRNKQRMIEARKADRVWQYWRGENAKEATR